MARIGENKSHAYLDQLSTSALQDLLRTDIESSEDCDNETIFYIMEVIDRREEVSSVDVDEAWVNFQKLYNTPEGEGLSLFPVNEVKNNPHDTFASTPRFKRIIWRHIAIVSILIITMFVGMVAVQASGLDIFGALARWTDETFHFKPQDQGDKSEDYHNEIQDAIDSYSILDGLSPTWFPENYEMTELKSLELKNYIKIHASFSNKSGNLFNIQIRQYNDGNIDTLIFEKDSDEVEKYISSDKVYYIMSNDDTITATWSDGMTAWSISGNLSEDVIKQIIDSMGA